MRRNLRWLVLGMWMLVVAGCGDDESSTQGGAECPVESCVSCEAGGDCAAWESCEGDDGICIPLECSTSGDCGEEGDCGADGYCEEAVAGCDDGRELCGEECCGDDEVCESNEICEDGECETVHQCRSECQGNFCGFDGELCCEGELSECGPEGQCAPNCEGEGELCGEDFDECCPAGDVCIFGDCRTPGEPCEVFTDCDFGEYCDEGLGQCLPDEFPDGLVCEDTYDFGEVSPEVAWQWDGVEVDGVLYDNVMMTPLVADMDGEGGLGVAFAPYADGSTDALVVVADGATGDTIYVNDARNFEFGSQLALVDITKNGRPEIVAIGDGDRGIGVIRDIESCPDPEDDEDDCLLWWNGDDVDSHQPAPLAADLNGNGEVEIVMGDAILDGMTGELLARLDAGGYGYTIAADITDEEGLELLGAGCLYRLDEDDELEEVWCASESVASDGRRFAAVGDLTDENGREGKPEIVLTGDGNVYVIAGDTGEVLYQFDLPGGGDGGSPIIADFDGDGSAEFGIASAVCYTVFDLDCVVPDGEGDGVDALTTDRPGCQRPEIETCEYGRHCACEALEDTQGTGDGILWSIYVQDESSARTGSSVFDFQGDGSNEVVYNDECLLMVLDGSDGSPYFTRGNTNRTSSEYPIVADVTGDGQTNIVVSANNDQFSRDCEDPINDRPERFPECHPEDDDVERPSWCDEGTTGVFALQDPEDRWVRTRSVWNQFDYHIDNAGDEAGAVPTGPDRPWESHNTFRANQQGEVPLNAPDVVVSSVQTNARTCPPSIEFRATIRNDGVSAIPAGMPVSLYRINSAGEATKLSTVTLDAPLSPGGVRVIDFEHEVGSGQFNVPLTFQVVANDDEDDPVRDCNPETSSYLVEDVECTIPL